MGLSYDGNQFINDTDIRYDGGSGFKCNNLTLERNEGQFGTNSAIFTFRTGQYNSSLVKDENYMIMSSITRDFYFDRFIVSTQDIYETKGYSFRINSIDVLQFNRNKATFYKPVIAPEVQFEDDTTCLMTRDKLILKGYYQTVQVPTIQYEDFTNASGSYTTTMVGFNDNLFTNGVTGSASGQILGYFNTSTVETSVRASGSGTGTVANFNSITYTGKPKYFCFIWGDFKIFKN